MHSELVIPIFVQNYVAVKPNRRICFLHFLVSAIYYNVV